MKKLALLLALTTAIPAHAGGPVIVEETDDLVAGDRDRDNSWIVPVVIGLLILGAVASGSGGDDAPADPGKDPQPCVFNGDGC